MKLHDCYDIYTHMDFPGGSVVKNPPAKQETWVQPGSGRSPGRRKWQPTPVFLPKKFHRQKKLQSIESQRVTHD